MQTLYLSPDKMLLNTRIVIVVAHVFDMSVLGLGLGMGLMH